MKNALKLIILPALLLATAGATHGAESEFLRTLDGQWSGKGAVKIRTNREPINVTCDFTSTGKGEAMSLDGKCRGLLVVSRAISADIVSDGGRYKGTYIGAGTGPAGLSGSRKGNSLNLNVRWAKEVNGDRNAVLQVTKLGQNGMQLRTIDKDPESGRSVVTSDITLERK